MMIKDVIQDLLRILPENTEVNETENEGSLKFDIETGSGTFHASATLKPSYVIIQAWRDYGTKISSDAKRKFNNEMADYFGYQIYIEKARLKITKRSLYQDSSEICGMFQDYLSTVKKIAEKLHEECLKDRDSGKPSDRAVHVMEEPPVLEMIEALDGKDEQKEGIQKTMAEAEYHENNSGTDQFETIFEDKQLAFSRQTFHTLADMYGTNVKEMPDEKCFSIPWRKGRLTMSLKDNAAEICIEYIANANEVEAEFIRSEARKANPDLTSHHNKESGKIGIRAYVVPDPYLPDSVNNAAEELAAIYSRGISVSIKAAAKDPSDFKDNLKEILEHQLSELTNKEDKIRTLLSDCEKREKELDERSRLLNEQEAILKKKERDLEESEKKIREGNNRYIKEAQDVANEIARIQAKIENDEKSRTPNESVARLKAKVSCLIKSRVQLESRIDELSKEINRLKAENSENSGSLSAHDEESFKERENELLREIEKLKEASDFSEEDLQIDAFEKLVKSNAGYDDVQHLHAEEKEILSFMIPRTSGKNIQVKVVFGKLLWVDASMEVKKIDNNQLCSMNAQVTDTKFFARGKEIIARKYFDRRISNEQLNVLVNDLSDYFE